jgi:hypothetical protein
LDNVLAFLPDKDTDLASLAIDIQEALHKVFSVSSSYYYFFRLSILLNQEHQHLNHPIIDTSEVYHYY